MLNQLSATESARQIAAGDLTSEALVAACLERIDTRESQIHAWEFVDPELALAQARARDAEDPSGPLHGVPVGIKDVFDTYDMPTEYGSEIYTGHQPDADSTSVAQLRAAGAVILGKTETTEFASPVLRNTRNPHDVTRSPGVSSSGSAAAVADFMVPLATGTQTGGSVILPAAYCGVYGYKASLDGIDRSGMRHLRGSLDTIGLFARSIEDLILMQQVFDGGSTADAGAAPPRIGLCRTNNWPEASPEAALALETAAAKAAEAGASVREYDLPDVFKGVEDAFRVVTGIEGQRAMSDEVEKHLETMNPWIRDVVEASRGWMEDDYIAAQQKAASCRAALAEAFGEFDFVLTPSTTGEATTDLDQVSNSAFNRLWTLMHGPAVTLPRFAGPNGLPVGIQVIGPVNSDAATLANAAWLDGVLAAG